ncbi:MAG: TauD/TfdA family dioxygenase [Flavobacteriales bacterium]|nr:TauD/TfdA family dioxygenase [Flavobacteriales bacterium]
MSNIENFTEEKASIQEIEKAIKDHDVSALSSIIRKEMGTNGFIHITSKMATDIFEEIGHQLGETLTNTSIKVDKQNEKKAIEARAYRSKDRPLAYSAKGINFHSDSPIQKTIGFYCVEQDKIDGSLLMLDMHPVKDHLSDDELSILKTITVNWGSMSDGKEVINKAPLFDEQNNAIEIYYASWHLQENISPAQQKVLTRFQDFITHTREQHLLKIRLQAGETIFVNNRRMLHARETIADNSQRHIIRLGIGLAN